jgi:hypothetical protein
MAKEGSAGDISRLFNVSKDSILRHKRHIAIAIRSTQSIKAQGFYECLKGIERLIRRVEKHLGDSQRSEGWFRKSAELRQWIALREKMVGKVVTDDPRALQARQGDTYCVQFIAPDGKPAKIPLAVYEALPKTVFGSETQHHSSNDLGKATQAQ